jgi:maltose/moltooligosaccharide transporter
MSDKTNSKMGRRTPYFLIGAILCSISLFWMPFSSTLWMAASILWILDAANNITMEPYRAFVSDKLEESQHSLGFLTQSAFTGLGQTLSYLTPSILVVMGMNANWVNAKNIPYITITAFIIGAFFSIVSIAWSVWTTPENPLTDEELRKIKENPNSFSQTFIEIADAFKEMPLTMKQLALVKLFQWYAMFCYWQYIVLSISTTFFGTTDKTSQAFRDAGLINGQVGGFYNFIAFLAAFAMVPFTRIYGPKITHSIALTLAGIGMICIPLIKEQIWLFIPMVGIGICWASMMGNPYVM